MTRLVWQELCNQYDPYLALRTCERDKVEYWRGVADMMDYLEKMFDAPKEK